MNNDQFRKLIHANASKQNKNASNGGSSPPSSAASRPAGTSSAALGSRLKSSIPMTPRSVAVGRSEFARQWAEQHGDSNNAQKKNSKFRTSVPKGSKLAAGYVDRARTRQEQEEADEREMRLAALEEALKKEEIDAATYERLRGEIAGGDLASTHLVKGLDFKLLERVRKGEDVYNEKPKAKSALGEDHERDAGPKEDVDDELEQLEATEVKAVVKEKTEKKGQLATTGLSLNPGQKRSRNQLLAELKAAREAAKAKQESALGSRFKKIGVKKAPGTRFETDSKGREVMIIVDEDGYERRKVRKLNPAAVQERQAEREAFVPDKNAKVLGMEVPEFYRKQQLEKEQEDKDKDDGDVNIFDDAGSDYDPLAGLEGSDEDEEEKEEEEEEEEEEGQVDESSDREDGEVAEEFKSRPASDTKDEKRVSKLSEPMAPPPKPTATASGSRNYFKDSRTALTSEQEYKSSVDDATFLAALKKAKALGAAEKSEEEQKEAARRERLQKMLQNSSRDDEDLDVGFGSSRLEDEADLEEDGAKVKLSAWGEDEDEDEGGGGGRKGGKEKRKKKRKGGDKNSFADVMRVIERNKGGGGK